MSIIKIEITEDIGSYKRWEVINANTESLKPYEGKYKKVTSEKENQKKENQKKDIPKNADSQKQAELKKDIAELKAKNEQSEETITELNSIITGLESTITDIEVENAELKTQLESMKIVDPAVIPAENKQITNTHKNNKNNKK